MDKMGEVIATSDAIVTREALLAVLPEFTGKIMQLPPMYSAIKRDGKNLYDLARKGIEVEREPREVEVHQLNLVDFCGDTAILDARVSKGTYIRVLADDIGKRLGTYAHLIALRRTEVGDLKIEDAVAFATVDNKTLTVEQRRGLLKGADFLLQSLPSIELDAVMADRLRNGQRLSVHSQIRGLARAYGPEDKLLGVVRVDARGIIHPHRLITFENNPVSISGED